MSSVTRFLSKPGTLRLSVLLLFAGTLVAILGAKWSLIHRFGSDVPYMDQWDAEAATMVIAHADGKPAAECILAFHNQHRPVLTKLLNYELIQLDGQWSPLLQMTVNALVHVAAIGFFLSFAKRTFAPSVFAGLCAFFLLLFTAAYAWENTLQGFQSQFYFLIGSAFLAISLMFSSEPLKTRWWLGALCGVVGLGSMGSSILAFVACGAVLVLQGLIERRWSLRHGLALAILVALTLWGFYAGADFSVYNDQKATTLYEGLRAFVSCLSWPGWPHGALAAFLPLPFLLLVWTSFRKRSLEPADAVIVAANVWSWLQMVALALTRGHGTPADSPRYYDVFVVSIIANAFALLRCWPQYRASLRLPLFGLWTLYVVTRFFGLYQDNEAMLTCIFAQVRDEERMICADQVRSDDPEYLKKATVGRLPYPSAERMLLLMAHPAVQAVLPPSLRKPLHLENESREMAFLRSKEATPPGSLPETVWTAEGGPGAFVSQPLSSRFPILRVQFKGSPSLRGAFLALRSEDGRETPVEVRSVAGDRWQTAHLFVPEGGGTFRLVARTENKEQKLVFAEPVEMGRYTYLARRVCKAGAPLQLAGLALVGAGLLLVVGRGLVLRPTRA